MIEALIGIGVASMMAMVVMMDRKIPKEFLLLIAFGIIMFIMMG